MNFLSLRAANGDLMATHPKRLQRGFKHPSTHSGEHKIGGLAMLLGDLLTLHQLDLPSTGTFDGPDNHGERSHELWTLHAQSSY
jgi:hypothetical protein